ncbi:DMT family transporter [Luteolibacter sp. AS25]|uniref:DMT family transporter n=1 Tax=Luteolibacter sp. AS25 TaxID=3135776 RepID=UPI00398B6B31
MGSFRGVEVDQRWFKVLPGALLCALLWGSAFPCLKTVYGIWEEQGFEPVLSDYWWFAGVRFTIAGVLLLLISRNPWRGIKNGPKLRLLTMSLTQTYGQYLMFYLAVAVASGSLTGLLASSGSFWWVLLAPMLSKAPNPSRGQWYALLVGGLGITLATAAPGTGAGRPLLGALLMIAGTGLGAVGIIEFGKIGGAIGARAATGFSLAAGGVLLLITGAGAISHMGELFRDPVVILITCWMSIVSAAAFALWNHLSTIYPVPLLAGYRFLIPLCGMSESLLFLKGESAGWGLIVGAVLVAGSLVMMQRAKARDLVGAGGKLRRGLLD